MEALCAANVGETLGYLARRPYDNVYVMWLIASRELGRGGSVALWRDEAGSLAGVCYFGPQIVPFGDAPEAFDAFAARARSSRTTRMIVGPRVAVERFWDSARDAMPRPSAVRTSQPVYALERSTLRGSRADAPVALATLAELDEIAGHSAAMIAGENGGDPQRSNAGFRDRTARLIAAGWWWRYRIERRLAFMCNVGSFSPLTAQLQGVWTPQAMRGHGYATQGLAAICDRLLDQYPTLCLYVNDFNTPAIALYERVGFERVGEFRTILFG
ncbi:MAG: GNAT family N-acetyltransferase [Candidatus Eremiobacteraeota bacterium]|nr:GNAT family N-acetyltransferase [Candidatus Eremiobacteraeota bacterium]